MKGRITSLHWMTAYGFVPLKHRGTFDGMEAEISRWPNVHVLSERAREPWPPSSLPSVAKSVDLLALHHRTLDDLSYLLGFDDFE